MNYRYLKSILTFNFKKRNLRILIQTTVSIPGVLFCLFLLSFGSSYPVFSLLVSCLSLCVYKGSSAHTVTTIGAVSQFAKQQTSQYSLVLAEGEVWMLLRESASILWWSQGIYTAKTQTGSYPNHINMIVTSAAPLHTNKTVWSQKTDRGLPGTQIYIFFPISLNTKHILPENINHGSGNLTFYNLTNIYSTWTTTV